MVGGGTVDVLIEVVVGAGALVDDELLVLLLLDVLLLDDEDVLDVVLVLDELLVLDEVLVDDVVLDDVLVDELVLVVVTVQPPPLTGQASASTRLSSSTKPSL
jgi:hypothetical protein